MQNIKKYWSGNKRLVSDLFWSCIINLFLVLIESGEGSDVLSPEDQLEHIFRFIGGVIGVFFLFFFWSWNKHHIKSRFAKYAIHILFAVIPLGFCFLLFSGVFFKMNFLSFLFSLIYHGLIVWKYMKLMWGNETGKRKLKVNAYSASTGLEKRYNNKKQEIL